MHWSICDLIGLVFNQILVTEVLGDNISQKVETGVKYVWTFWFSGWGEGNLMYEKVVWFVITGKGVLYKWVLVNGSVRIQWPIFYKLNLLTSYLPTTGNSPCWC